MRNDKRGMRENPFSLIHHFAFIIHHYCGGVPPAAGGVPPPARVPLNVPVPEPTVVTVPRISLPVIVPVKVASVVCVPVVMGTVNLMSPDAPTEAFAIWAELKSP